MIDLAIQLAENRRLPDRAIRFGIRRLLARRLKEASAPCPSARESQRQAFVTHLRQSPIAIHPDSANEQHYEVPPAFFQTVLGPRLKYSCCLFDNDSWGLEEAEDAMLRLTCERARLADGQDILELGCGWGALTLWMGEHYPSSTITAVSNSALQRRTILDLAKRRDLANIQVLTADMNDFDSQASFDRVVSLEMFEHMHNYDALMARIAQWLKPGGFLFVHIFTHRSLTYEFKDAGSSDWMARHFFTGGIMPCDHLLLYFQRYLALDQMWIVDGGHYEKTCNLWLEKLDRNSASARAALATCYGEDAADLWLQRWRIFFMACAELFGYRRGTEWHVCHYRFHRPGKDGGSRGRSRSSR